MLEFFNYSFIVRAIIVGGLAATCLGLLGNYIVAARQSVASEMLAHSSLAGVGLGLLLGLSPTLFGIIFAVLAGTYALVYARRSELPNDAISMMFLLGGVALAILFASKATNPVMSFDSYLFGSILTTSWSQIYGFMALSAMVLSFVLMFGNRLKTLIFDRDYYESRFGNSKLLELTFAAMVSCVIGLSIQIIGGLLIAALVVIPVLCAQQVSKSFRSSMLWSIIINLLAVWTSIWLSFSWDLPTSSLIVLLLIGTFVLLRLSSHQRA